MRFKEFNIYTVNSDHEKMGLKLKPEEVTMCIDLDEVAAFHQSELQNKPFTLIILKSGYDVSVSCEYKKFKQLCIVNEEKKK